MKKVALLLDSRDNQYQSLLARSAAVRASELGMELVGPTWADGSSFTQLDQVLTLSRDGGSVDAIILSVAGTASDLPAAKRVCKTGISIVYLNRVPDHVAELRRSFQRVLVAGVTPDQQGAGRIQAEQCRKVLPQGGFVLVVTGVRTSASAEARLAGFQSTAGEGLSSATIEGRWSAQGAVKALTDWFRLGAARDRTIGVVVCQNDQMARGVRSVLIERARELGTPSLIHTPILGCDGLESEGQQMVLDGELTATVIMPPTTPAALDLLAEYWRTGQSPEVRVLPVEAFPPVARLTPREQALV